MRFVLLQVFAGDARQALPDLREVVHHAMEIVGGDAHHFHVIQRRTGRRAASAVGQQADFAEIAAAAQVGQHQVAPMCSSVTFTKPMRIR